MLPLAARWLCALLALAALPASAAAIGQGLPTGQNRVRVELVPEPSTARPGEPFQALLRMRIAPGWHTYWINPGDSGLATSLEWQLPSGVTAGALSWPVPKRLPVGPLMNYGYEDEVLLPVQVTVPAAFSDTVLRVAARAEWLVCKDVCIPESAAVGFQLPVAPIAALADPRTAPLFAAARAALPGSLPAWTATASAADGRLRIALRAPVGIPAPAGEVYFYNATEGQVAHAAAQTVARHRDGLLIDVPLQPQPVTPVGRMDGLLVAAAGFGPGQPVAATIGSPLSSTLPDLGPLLATTTVAGPAARVGQPFAVAPPPQENAAAAGLLVALLLALAGGLVLNLMPCVFPVLSLKALAMVGQASSDPRGLRSSGLAFGAGVLLAFWTLAGTLIALRAGGEQVGWGFQLQSPPFIAAMAVLFTLLALNLAGVFEVGSRVAALAGSLPERKGPAGSFFNGMLAVAVAAPCTAPFMGAALGYALAQPAPHALAVFTALALGMALPYLLLSFVPGLARMLPRPGHWMVTFRQAMVFPLLATVAWLAWVLGLQAGVDAVFGLLAGLVLIAFAAWLYGHFAVPAASRGSRAIALGCGLLVALAGGYLAWPPATQDAPAAPPAAARQGDAHDPGQPWQAWSPDRVAALRAEGRAVFIDFTAAWCVTCQANKQLVLDTAAVREAFARRNTATLRADWTRRDRAISEALAGYGRSGVPVYVLYLPGRDAPILLPELLTRDGVRAALDGAPEVATGPR